MRTLADLSVEIIDNILFALDPLDVARVSQTSHVFFEIIYGPHSQQLWRGLYLAQPLDDPRRTVTHLGHTRDEIDWKGELQRIIRARTVMQCPTVCRREERCQVLRACIDLVANLPPISSLDDTREMARNLWWVTRQLGDGEFLDRDSWEALSEEEEQLLARLHVSYGLTRRDFDPERRRASQAFIYSQRHRTAERAFGPFMPDGRKRVDWSFVWMFVHGFGMLLREASEGGDSPYMSPLSLLFSQNYIPQGLNLNKEDDWAGVEGLWTARYAFIDHREFIGKHSVLSNLASCSPTGCLFVW